MVCDKGDREVAGVCVHGMVPIDKIRRVPAAEDVTSSRVLRSVRSRGPCS